MKKINKMNKVNKVNKDIIKTDNGMLLSRKHLLMMKRAYEVELKFGYDENGKIICLNPEDSMSDAQVQRDFNKFAKAEYCKASGIPVVEPTFEPYTCCICGEVHTDFGNNPDPVMKHGKCCDFCNQFVVKSARSKQMENVG
ncbi:hypothetical protein [Butyricicoccus pullicaecorum]|uniref:hypothetical protein n=1 Tax=Butyricicoccus pullicaecorum TaxID=501571 RepID=UPI0039907DEE